MAFPTTPLPVSVLLAPGANPAAPQSFQFTDITADVRVADHIQIQVGRQDEADQVDASSCRMTIDNRSGNYNPRNPLGTWYGSLAKNSPVQVRITRINDPFNRTVGSGLGTEPDSGIAWTTSGVAWSVNGSAALGALAAANTAGFATHIAAGGDDVDVQHTASISAVATGAAWVHSTVVRYTDGNNYYRLHTEFAVGGTIACKVARVVAGVTTDLTAVISTGISYSAGTQIRTRAQAFGSTLRIKAWLASGSEPAAWTAQADDIASAGRGTLTGLYEWRVNGNTNAGTMTCTIEDFRMDVIRVTTPVPEWPVRWDQSGVDVTAPVVGAGILRRLGQGQSALRSPLYRQLSALSPQGYWPGEDGSDATAVASATAGGNPATYVDVTLGDDDCPPGASSSALLNTASTSSIAGTVVTPTVTPDGYGFLHFFKPGAGLGATYSNVARFDATGTVVGWYLRIANTTWALDGLDASGASVVSTTSGLHVLDVTKWISCHLDVTESGGTVTWQLIYNQVGSPIFRFFTGSYSGTADAPVGYVAYAPTDGTRVCHTWLGDNDLPYVTPAFLAVAAGYAGELAGDRLTRLCAEEGVPLAILGATSTTAAMGVQRAATFLDLARECEAADQGTLIERGAGLGYIARNLRYNAPVTMSLNFASGHIAAPPEPTDDDQRLRNQIKLHRAGGSEVTVENAASILASGTISDEVTVNLATDGVLLDHAGWRLHLGTLDEPRWPRIELDLARNPNIIRLWCQIRIGSRLTISNPPAAVAGASLDLIVEGWTETLGPFSWDVVLVCSPASAWDVGVYDGTVRRADSRSTTVPAGATISATSLGFSTVLGGDVWSTTTPYDVVISGQRCTVTAMTAPAGTGPYTQTATVTRAVNGISKPLPANAEVHVYQPARWAL